MILWCLPGESERVPLEVGDLGAADEDVLTSTGGGLFLLDLELYNFRGVLDDLGDVGTVPRTNFTKHTLEDPDDATDKPVALRSGHHQSVNQ